MIRKVLILLVSFFGLNATVFSQLAIQKSNYPVNKSVLTSAEETLVGYNLYRNGIKINAIPLLNLAYMDTVPDNGAFTYYVTALYTGGESGASNSVEVVIDQNAILRDYVIFEEGTGTWCQYCPGGALGLEDLIKNGKKVLGIAYHNGDEYANSDANSRLNFYNVTGFPTSIFDGVEVVGGGSHTESMYDYYLPAYEKRIGKPTTFKMAASGTYSGNSYSVNIVVETVSANTSSNLKVMAAIVEDHIDVAWQGLTELNAVERKMLPNASGTPVSFLTDNQQVVNLTFSYNTDWAKENCSLVTFIQDITTKEIFQATVVKLSDFVPESSNLKAAALETFFAPYDLAATYTMVSPTVNLSWKAPGNPRWMQWDNGQNANAIGSNSSPLDFDVAARWDVNDLSPLDGMVISKIAFFPNEASCKYTVKIWDGETDEHLLVDSLLPTVQAGKWKEVILPEVHVIDIHKELWVGYFNDNSKNKFSAGCDAGPAIVGKGDKIRMVENGTPGVWENVSDYGIDANWNIKVYVEPYVAPVDTTTVKENIRNSFLLYPNPTAGKVTVEAEYAINSLYVIGINGQVVADLKPFNQRYILDVSNYQSGIYFVKIVTKKGYSFQKLIIE
jgi:hypothetical protein